jgi:glyoxylase-like metal-dependent hydrolase (beta-lactamase superfamily II)
VTVAPLKSGLRWLSVTASCVSLVMLTCLVGCGDSSEAKRIQDLRRRLAEQDATLEPQPYRTSWLGSSSITVAPGIHALALNPSAAYAIETSQGVILIDAGVDEEARLLRECLLSVGISIDQIRYVLITHAHYDHVFGSNRVREVSDAVVCAGAGDCETLRNADRQALFSLFPRTPFSGNSITVDRELVDGDTITLGDTKVQVMATPGHTPGSVCYLLERSGKRFLFSGDVVASMNFGPATYPVYLPPRFKGDAGDYAESIQRLLDMDPPDMLLTGHPRQQRQPQSLELDTQHWQGLLTSAKDELQTALDRRRDDGADFLDGIAKQIDPGMYYLGDLESTAVYWITYQELSILVNAPGKDQLFEFLATSLKSLGLPANEPDIVLLTSGNQTECSGLTSLTSSPKVIAPFAREINSKIPNVVSQEQLKSVVPDFITVIPLGKDAVSSSAYSMYINSRQVLITPAIPRNISIVWTNRENGRTVDGPLQPQFNELRNHLSTSRELSDHYRSALQQLAEVSPDVWLPALPLTGQNANLYDDQWKHVIESNLKVAPGR